VAPARQSCPTPLTTGEFLEIIPLKNLQLGDRSMNGRHQVIVRQATIVDLDLVAPLFDAYRQFYRKPADLDLAKKFLLERFQHNESIIFLAIDEGGAALGFVQLFPSFSSGAAASILILNDLFVAPETRRSGIGALLLHAAADYGKSVGAVRLTLSTEVTNTSAQALYEAEGWKLQTEFCVYNLSLTN
jgi:GNAT superfamily N-acetyltransferase